MHPDHLYHYTSIATLARILHTGKLRLNRLDRVDDLQEAKSSDLGDAGRLYFVSCWSNSAEESIPLWSMYTPNMGGVRIKLAAKMFRKYIIQPQWDGFIEVTTPIESPIPYDRFVTDQYIVHPMVFNIDLFLRKVEYTDDQARLCPSLMSREGGGVAYDLGRFGVCKRPEWQFQNEWRYILMILP
jgi:hypothetical protein